MSTTPEGRVKADVKKWLFNQGFVQVASKVKDRPDHVRGWYYMPVQNGMGVTGIPDFICCWNGRFLGIETKAPGKRNTSTPNQLARAEEIQAAKGWACVIDDVSQLDDIFQEWL